MVEKDKIKMVYLNRYRSSIFESIVNSVDLMFRTAAERRLFY